MLGLAIAAGASSARSSEWVAGGFLVVSLAVTGYALGQKLIPGVHVAGVFDFNQTGQFARLQEPFGYWNALALFISMGVPIALALTVDRQRSSRLRLGALIAVELMFLAIGFTYSRGGLIALALGTAAAIALGGLRLRIADVAGRRGALRRAPARLRAGQPRAHDLQRRPGPARIRRRRPARGDNRSACWC